MNNREYLEQTYNINRRIKDKKERIEHLKGLAMSIGATDYAKDRVQTSPNNEASFVKIIANIESLEEELKNDVIELLRLQSDISHAIDDVKDVNCSLVLSKRYLLMKKWEQIADDMGYSVVQIHRIHNKALEIFKIPQT